MLGYNTVSACGGPYDNCIIGTDDIQSFKLTLIDYLIIGLIYLGIIILVSFPILLGFYFFYKHNNITQPFRLAIKKGLQWFIILFFIPIIIFGVFYFIYDLDLIFEWLESKIFNENFTFEN